MGWNQACTALGTSLAHTVRAPVAWAVIRTGPCVGGDPYCPGPMRGRQVISGVSFSRRSQPPWSEEQVADYTQASLSLGSCPTLIRALLKARAGGTCQGALQRHPQFSETLRRVFALPSHVFPWSLGFLICKMDLVAPLGFPGRCQVTQPGEALLWVLADAEADLALTSPVASL